MRAEVSRLEQELLACRAQREKESQELSLLAQDDREREEKEKEAMQSSHSQILSELRESHKSEIDTLRQNLEMKGVSYTLLGSCHKSTNPQIPLV